MWAEIKKIVELCIMCQICSYALSTLDSYFYVELCLQHCIDYMSDSMVVKLLLILKLGARLKRAFIFPF